VEPPIEREDVLSIMTSLMGLHAKADVIVYLLGGGEDEEEEDSA
jgi:hypothetical protein